ncbi:palmitoyltransferase ZDHHC11-like isoform X2 [Symsagittifera roscoffensis]|uniref:palmitoyltransferase ZDHHC11-like isoform X2 n=1 Tax=Symsagittifera roscoffensis TaxID=84072 RepID=UPI00307C4FBA
MTLGFVTSAFHDNSERIYFLKMSTVAPEVESEDGMHSNSRSYGSTKNLTASENNDKNGGGAATPAYHNEVRQKTPRRNGWQRPWNAMLFALVIIPVLLALAFLGSFPLCVPYSWRPAAFIIFSCAFSIFYGNFLLSATINAAEPTVSKLWGQKKARLFPKDPSKLQEASSDDTDTTNRSSVIRNNFCYICDAFVGRSAKHCGQCNKCVEGFDHHCLWLNNCVGKRNYRYFIYTLVVGIIILFGVVICSAALIFVAALDQDKIQTWIASNGKGETDFVVFGRVSRPVFLVYNCVLVLVATVILGFTLHLLAFHIYLNWRSMSTYDYIVRQRKLVQQQQLSFKSSGTGSSLCLKREHSSSIERKPTTAPVGTEVPIGLHVENGDLRVGLHGNEDTQFVSKEEATNNCLTPRLMGTATSIPRVYKANKTNSDDTGAKSEEAQLSISGVNSVDRIDRKIDEDLTSQPEVSQKVQSDLDESLNENKGYEPNFDEESSNQEEESEVLREISIHDTYNGAIGNRSFSGLHML